MMTRIVLICSILLGIALSVSHVLLGGLADTAREWVNGLRTGIGLLLFWVFVTAAVRSLHQFRPAIAFVYSVVTGVATAFFGILSFLFLLRLLALLWNSTSTLPTYSILGFYSAAGVIASLFSLIHLRIRNRTVGTILEFILIIGGAALFIWLVD